MKIAQGHFYWTLYRFILVPYVVYVALVVKYGLNILSVFQVLYIVY